MKEAALLMVLTVFASLNSGCLVPDAPNERTIDTIEATEHILAVDASFLPQLLASGTVYYDASGVEVEPLVLFREQGVNTLRLRVWVNPATNASSLSEVAAFAATARDMGFNIWIAPHFSDTWADPGWQAAPEAWSEHNFSELNAAVAHHVRDIMVAINPDIIQLGNEINHGFLHPHGRINNGSAPFLQLLETASQTVRNHSSTTSIMLHYAGHEGSLSFFHLVDAVDYDIIGLSFYPLWHGQSLLALGEALQNLSSTYDKDVLVAETAYPFTLDWYDWTDNIVGSDDQLILPAYPATPTGQLHFLTDLKQTVLDVDRGLGFAYWAPEWVAWDGNRSETGSPWENQALFDEHHRTLPAFAAFGKP